MSWYQQQLKITVRLVSHYFQPQIDVAASDIALNIFSEAWPIVFPANQLPCFVNTKMTCQKIVVMLADEFGLDDFWHKR